MRAIIYLRVSTQPQRERGYGLQEQKEICQLEANRLGINKKLIFTDTLSGDTNIYHRPGLKKALLALKKGDCLIVSHRDRLAKRAAIMLDIASIVHNAKAQLIIATEHHRISNQSVLQLTVEDLIAEKQLNDLRNNTRAVLQKYKQENKRVGTIKFGYKQAEGNRLEVNKEEQKAIGYARKLRKLDYTFEEIVKDMSDLNFMGRNKKPFGITQVHRMINNNNDSNIKSSKENNANRNSLVKTLRLKGYSIGQITRELNRQGFATKKGTPLRNTQTHRILGQTNIQGPHTNRFVPYGFQKSPTGTLYVCLPEQEVITLVQTLRKQKKYSYSQIITHINAKHTSRAGTPFGKTQIIRMLQKQVCI
jgi:DNA invertase Pin-like site-specific DNA recombinase